MTTLREQAVAAVVERLAAVGTTVTRNDCAGDDRERRLCRHPRRLQRGGRPHAGDHSYWITHRVSVEAIVGGGDPSGALDELRRRSRRRWPSIRGWRPA